MADVYLSPAPRCFDTGFEGYGTQERRMSLIADIVEYELSRHGVSTARCVTDMTVTEAVAQANAEGSRAYVSLRSQCADTSLCGVQIYHRGFDRNSQRLASDIFDFLTVASPFEAIGLTDGYSAYGGLGFYELRRTKMPSAIVMPGFHDNPDDARFIIKSTYEIGRAVARGILEYFGTEYNGDSTDSISRLSAEYNGISF